MGGHSRREDEAPEDESYYISMTDMMVGVVFIFILLLVFFGLQYHQTTEALTKADDPKTAALLATADKLENKTVALQIDYANKVVCLPTAALAQDAGEGAPAAGDRRCFAYSAVKAAATPSGPTADEARASVTTFVSADLAAAKTPVQADAANGALNFDANALFQPGTDTLSPGGAGVAASVAASLAGRLPCYGYGPAVDGACPSAAKMAAVTVAGNTSFNAFSAEGQAAYALALKRTVAFYKALTADQPVLGQIRDAADPAAPPLLRVASAGQSTAAAAAASNQQFISVQFVMAP